MDPVILLVIANAVGAGLIVIRWLSNNEWSYKYIRNAASSLARLSPLYGISKTLKEIRHEVYTNGGHSLRDAINRIEARADTIHNDVALLRVKLRYREIAEGAAVFITDHEGRCTYTSPAYLALSGLTAESVLDWGWLNAVYQEDREFVSSAWATAVTHLSEYAISHRYQRRTDKQIINVSVSALPAIVMGKAVAWFGEVKRDDGLAMTD